MYKGATRIQDQDLCVRSLQTELGFDKIRILTISFFIRLGTWWRKKNCLTYLKVLGNHFLVLSPQDVDDNKKAVDSEKADYNEKSNNNAKF